MPNGPHRLKIGLKPLSLGDWIEDQPDFGSQLEVRREVLDRHPDVIVRAPESSCAEHELLAMLTELLPASLPQHYTRVANGLRVEPTGEVWPIEVAEKDPLGTIARWVPDDFCFMHALHTQTSAHPQGENFMNTGFTMEGFPSFGSWTTYALGSENDELPSFVAINDPRGPARSGKNNFGNGFLPAAFQGTDFNAKNPPANLARPAAYSAQDDKATVGLLQRLNGRHLEKYPKDADLAARIASYELAGKMQTSIPEVMNISNEPVSIRKEYGIDSGTDLKREYAKNCILARRLIEKGVRVVQLFNGSDPSGGNGITNWDSHSNIAKTHAMQAEIMDQPTAALISDMKRRGLLKDTLIVWCSEFGRMPFLQGNGTGRDHNPDAFTCFFAGAGVKKGFSYGESDEFGFKSVSGKTSIYDFNATILHLMGLDHERLSYYNNGLERRLTNVHGHVVKDVLA